MTNCNPCNEGKITHHEVIFPNGTANHSHVFEVKNNPVVIKALNLPCSVEGRIEMGVFQSCATWVWGPYMPECGQVMITGCTNIVAIGVPGTYRIVFDADDMGDLDDVILVQSEGHISQQILQLYGGTTMACGSQVTVTTDPTTGCMTIVVDGVPSTICPGGGSDVSITENATSYVLVIDGVPTTIAKAQDIQCTADGITIDGVLCAFPTGADVSLTQNPNGTHTLVVDGQTVTIYGEPPAGATPTSVVNNGDGTFTASNPSWPAPVTWVGTDTVTPATTVVNNGDGTFTASNPSWPGPVTWIGTDANSITTAAYNAVTRVLTITNPDGNVVNVPIAQNAVVSYDTATEVYSATNPDGSIVTWRDENSVTTVSYDATTNTVVVVNPDGSTVTFPAGSPAPDLSGFVPRTQFQPHYGNDGTTVLFYAPTSI